MNTLFETGQDGGTATTHDWLNRCHFGDCLETLRGMPDGIVNTCVTSPPYFGLRSYLPDDSPDKPLEIGLEETPEQYVARMVEVFRCVRDVLSDDGTLWLNIGDSYAANRSYQVPSTKGGAKHGHGQAAGGKGSRVPDGLKPKDLIGIPWLLAFALRADGWYLRQEIIWHKPNPMPESVTDRCTKSHEQIFLMAKSASYYFDSEAMKEPASQPRGEAKKTGQHKSEVFGHSGTLGSNQGAGTRNRRSVWTVATVPYKGAHFATFPPDLIEPCILAGAPAGGIVLDPFFGSGTTGQVAQALGRQFIGIELNEAYKPLQDERLRQPSLLLEAA